MKTLFIMRHADATWEEDRWPDFDRPLNEYGEQQAPQMGRRLRMAGLSPDGIVCSAALRTHQTAKHVATELGNNAPVQVRHELYMATIREWERTVCNLPEEWGAALCVAHNPGVQELIIALRQRATRVPPATLAIVSLPIDHWEEFNRSTTIEAIDVWYPER